MKKTLISLAVASGLLVGSSAWAGVVVHAGPVHVGVGVGRPVVRPVAVRRPAYVAPRPVVVRPPVVRPAVVAAPRPVVVAAPPVVTAPVPVPVPAIRAADATLRARRLLNAIHHEVEEAVEDALQSQN